MGCESSSKIFPVQLFGVKNIQACGLHFSFFWRKLFDSAVRAHCEDRFPTFPLFPFPPSLLPPSLKNQLAQALPPPSSSKPWWHLGRERTDDRAHLQESFFGERGGELPHIRTHNTHTFAVAACLPPLPLSRLSPCFTPLSNAPARLLYVKGGSDYRTYVRTCSSGGTHTLARQEEEEGR